MCAPVCPAVIEAVSVMVVLSQRFLGVAESVVLPVAVRLGLSFTLSDLAQYAKEQGKTYNDVFKEYMPTAVELMEAAVIQARAQSKDIVWDQTNMSVKSRARKFRMLPNYEHIAVVFKTPDAAEHARRLASRPGKTIPQPVLDSMAANFEMPTKTEGFTEIWFAN